MNEHVVWLLEVLGVIAAVGSAAAVIYKVVLPFKKASDKIKEHDDRLNKMDETLKEIKEMQKMQCKCSLVQMEHEITGNGIEKLKNAKSEMQTFLIEKVQ